MKETTYKLYLPVSTPIISQMKNLIFILFLFILFSCNMTIESDFWSNNSPVDCNKMSNKKIEELTRNRIKDGTGYKYKTPQKVEDDRYSWCFGKAVWMMSILYRDKGIKGQLLLVDTNGDGKTNHAMVYACGHKYLKSKLHDNYNIIETIDFNHVPYYYSCKKNMY